MRPWWERLPARYRFETDALDWANIEYQVDDEALAKGIMSLRLRFVTDDQEYWLQAIYPDLFPYFRPEVIADKLNLNRHQNPFEKQLCLIGRRTHNWNPDDTVAGLLTEQFPKLLAIDFTASEDDIAKIEQNQGEPFSDYYAPYCLGEAYVFIDSQWSVPDKENAGVFDLQYSAHLADDGTPRITGIISSIKRENGQELHRWTRAIPKSFDKVVKGRWVRCDPPPLKKAPPQFKEELVKLHPKFLGKSRAGSQITIPAKTSRLSTKKDFEAEIIGVLFSEEVLWRQSGDGWLFLFTVKKKKRKTNPQHGFIRAFRAGEMDMGVRVPALHSLRRRRIAVFGVGAVGAPLATELMRNGAGELHLIDHDIVEPGPTVRWPFGVEAVGYAKVDVLSDFALAHYPDTVVFPHKLRLGSIRLPDAPPGPSQVDSFDDILRGVDLVIDTSAEVGVAQYLADQSAQRKIPFISAYSYPGAWGGVVARFQPGTAQGCWICLRRALFEPYPRAWVGAVARFLPAMIQGWWLWLWRALFRHQTINEPPFNETTEDGVQPAGCADPTFLGASFDLAEISLEACRMAVSTLGQSSEDYSVTPWDVAVLSLRNEKGERIPPRWDTHNLGRNPRCRCSKMQKK